jgi:hypothetical protein
MARDLATGARLMVRYAPPATLALELPLDADPFGNHVAALLEQSGDAPAGLPLGVAIAHAVLERNGAHVAPAPGIPSTVFVRFTAADDEEALVGTNGTTAPRIGR